MPPPSHRSSRPCPRPSRHPGNPSSPRSRVTCWCRSRLVSSSSGQDHYLDHCRRSRDDRLVEHVLLAVGDVPFSRIVRVLWALSLLLRSSIVLRAAASREMLGAFEQLASLRPLQPPHRLLHAPCFVLSHCSRHSSLISRTLQRFRLCRQFDASSHPIVIPAVFRLSSTSLILFTLLVTSYILLTLFLTGSLPVYVYVV